MNHLNQPRAMKKVPQKVVTQLKFNSPTLYSLVPPLIRVRNQMVYATNGSSATFECEVSFGLILCMFRNGI